jgi:hypothetical protein
MVHENKDVYLDEANVLGVAAEALPAAHQPILPDQSMRVTTHPAAKMNRFGVRKTIIFFLEKQGTLPGSIMK